MKWMDKQRCVAVAKVVNAFAPWSDPTVRQGAGKPMVELDFMPAWRVLVMPTDGTWMIGDVMVTDRAPVPLSLPESMGITTSEGGQTVGGHVLMGLTDRYHDF